MDTLSFSFAAASGEAHLFQDSVVEVVFTGCPTDGVTARRLLVVDRETGDVAVDQALGADAQTDAVVTAALEADAFAQSGRYRVVLRVTADGGETESVYGSGLVHVWGEGVYRSLSRVQQIASQTADDRRRTADDVVQTREDRATTGEDRAAVAISKAETTRHAENARRLVSTDAADVTLLNPENGADVVGQGPTLPHLRALLSGEAVQALADIDVASNVAQGQIAASVGVASDAADTARTRADLMALGDVAQAYRKATKAALAALAPADGTPGLVYVDESRGGEKNVFYLRAGGAWVYQGSLDNVDQRTFFGRAPYINTNAYLVSLNASSAVNEIRSKLADPDLSTVVVSGRGGTFAPVGDVRVPPGKRLIIEPGATYRPTHTYAAGLYSQPETGVKAALSDARHSVVAFYLDAAGRVENHGVIDLDGLQTTGGGRWRQAFFLRGAHKARVLAGLVVGGQQGVAIIDTDYAVVEGLDWTAGGSGNAGVEVEMCRGLTVRDIVVRGGEEALDANRGAIRCLFDGIRAIGCTQSALDLNNSLDCVAVIHGIDTPEVLDVFDYNLTTQQVNGIFSSRGWAVYGGGHQIAVLAEYTSAYAHAGENARAIRLRSPGAIDVRATVRLAADAPAASLQHALYYEGDRRTVASSGRASRYTRSEIRLKVEAPTAGLVTNPFALLTEPSTIELRPDIRAAFSANQKGIQISQGTMDGTAGVGVYHPLIQDTAAAAGVTALKIDGDVPGSHRVVGGLYPGCATGASLGANTTAL